MHEESGFFVLDDMQVWEGSRGEPVKIAEVERAIASVGDRFPVSRIVCDPWQMSSTIQRFNGRIEEFRFSAGAVARLSSNLLNVITTAKLRMYADDELFDELVELQAEQTSYGWRIDHARNKHDDRAMALGMAALVLAERARSPRAARTRQSRARITRRAKWWTPTDEVVGGQRAWIDGHGRVVWRPIGKRAPASLLPNNPKPNRLEGR